MSLFTCYMYWLFLLLFISFLYYETKGSSKPHANRQPEEDKITCSIKHFEALDDVTYDKCVTFDEFVKKFLFEAF